MRKIDLQRKQAVERDTILEMYKTLGRKDNVTEKLN
jgi:hypothetical protein